MLRVGVFTSGYLAGKEYARSLDLLARRDWPPSLVTIGRFSDGEEERVEHEGSDPDLALDHVANQAYTEAVVIGVHGDHCNLLFGRPGSPSEIAFTATYQHIVRGSVAAVGISSVGAPQGGADKAELLQLLDGLWSGLQDHDYEFALIKNTCKQDSFAGTPMYETGFEAGLMLVETLVNYADADPPFAYPCGAIARDRDEEQFAVASLSSLDDRNDWCADPRRQDAVVFCHLAPEPFGREHELMLAVPRCNGTADLAFTMTWQVELRDDQLLTSTALLKIHDDAREQFEAFHQGLDQGMRFHARTHELDAGWGKLPAP